MDPLSPQSQLHLFAQPERNKITHIIKRDGRLVAFNKLKIVNAIYRAAVAVGGRDRDRSEALANQAMKALGAVYPAGSTPSVEEIQDVVEKVLIENGHAKTAKAFILYRLERARTREKKPEVTAVEDYIPYKVLWRVLSWNVDHGCHTVEGLNAQMAGGWKKLIRDAERAYHDEIHHVADIVLKRLPDVRLVIVAGPSSSGKTTTTMKISERLKSKGHPFLLLNLDNYFRELSEQPKDEYGDYDFEMPVALDLPLINEHLGQLMEGRPIHMPIYNFKTGRREKETKEFRLRENEILLIDSLHGLYDGMTGGVAPETKFKFYIEALSQIKDADGEYVRWADLRLMRRMVRDSWHRSYDPAMTVGHWHYVRRSELRYIVPYIQRVDYIFNGALPYELPYHRARLADHMPAIVEKFKGDPKKADALLRAERLQRLMAALKSPASTDDVPDDSLLREFIGGSRYHY
ncbi:MAG TPA: ATP cone domain-containing protein [Elusimicrobiota bacterium]|nr:ATP cone domain-containing protein [Elusimicrobiota bacterium]